jgi:predicted dienelactone hydrolase
MPGPYKFATNSEGMSNPAYASSIMYYPTDAPPPYAVIVFSPGFTATKEDYTNYYGAMIASHGMVVLLTSPTSTSDQPRARGTDLEAAVAQIAKENVREGSPVKGKLAPDRICVTGHSMGGGGTLWAATSLGNKIKCALPLQPWQPGQSFAQIVAPTMFIAAQSDTIATVSSNAWTHYQSIPATVAKYFVEFTGADHYLSTNRAMGPSIAAQAKWMIPFYKAYLEDDPRYLALLNAPKSSDLSRYEKSK